jgi:tetratricopeptide (TPR) repeat protein
LTGAGFRVRMEAREAAIYGPSVLELLQRARDALTVKYDVELPQTISVEIFPQQKDFAVRTFGLPGAEGFLGVCFGKVITANSPAALGGSSANWQSVLWHEFCHVVTLHKSRNKMPRWLSEGISVYEERQENPAWGQSMTPRHRATILSGEMTPLSQLSSAFLSPESAADLEFAYFESSLAVEYLVEQYGLETLKKLLDELGGGMAMDDALVHHVAPLPRLDAAFAAYARRQAEALAPELTWDELELPPEADSAELAEWLDEHPENFSGTVRLGQALVREKKWKQSIEHATRLRELFPTYVGPGNAYQILARAHRELSDAAGECEALEAWATRDAEAVDAYLRLMELGDQAGDWDSVQRNALRMLAVNPLTPAPHRWLARAAEKLGDTAAAIAAHRALLQFDTADPVDAHYQLALLLRQQGDLAGARREALLALEEAPRFLAGHRLLLELTATDAADENPASP